MVDPAKRGRGRKQTSKSQPARAKKIGDTWIKARNAMKLSQSAAAALIGISPAYLSLIEAGKRPNPSTSVLCDASGVYKLTIEQLLGKG